MQPPLGWGKGKGGFQGIGGLDWVIFSVEAREVTDSQPQFNEGGGYVGCVGL